MSFFSEIVTSLLTENISIGSVNDAIDRTYEVEINYRTNGEDKATGKRIIQPVAYGLTKAGNPVIRAFQPYGDTTSKTPSWKFFRIDRITSWKPKYKQIFKQAPPGMFSAEGEFNPNGDKTMSVVYNIAQFNNKPKHSDLQTGDNGGPVKKDKIKKKHYSYKDNETLKKIDGLRKQLDNPIYISDILKKDSDDKEINSHGTGPVLKQQTAQEPRHISYKDNDAITKLNGIKTQLEEPKRYAPGFQKPQINTGIQRPTTGPITKTSQQTVSDKLNDIDRELTEPQRPTTGPVTKTTQSPQQLYKAGDKVPQSVLDDWNNERQKRK